MIIQEFKVIDINEQSLSECIQNNKNVFLRFYIHFCENRHDRNTIYVINRLGLNSVADKLFPSFKSIKSNCSLQHLPDLELDISPKNRLELMLDGHELEKIYVDALMMLLKKNSTVVIDTSLQTHGFYIFTDAANLNLDIRMISEIYKNKELVEDCVSKALSDCIDVKLFI